MYTCRAKERMSSSTSEWQPPSLTEEERLAIQAKQKERELLSNAMGQYLLKGYRMLGENCDQCGVNILIIANSIRLTTCNYSLFVQSLWLVSYHIKLCTEHSSKSSQRGYRILHLLSRT